MLERRDLMARVTWEVSDGGNGHSYEWVPERVTFHEARALADAMGGHLVTIQSQAEASFVDRLSPANLTWIGAQGGTGIYEDEHWEWVTGEPMEFEYWSENEPNNLLGSASVSGSISTPESAVVMQPSFGWRQIAGWNDTHIGERWSYLVEFDGKRDIALSDAPYGVNDARSLATDLGTLSGLTTIDAALRKGGDRDWYQFQAETSGTLVVRYPNTADYQLVTTGGTVILNRGRSPGFVEYSREVTAGESYAFAIASDIAFSFAAREIPYQLLIAPPGSTLPAVTGKPLPQQFEDISLGGERLEAGAIKYYGLTELPRADIVAGATFTGDPADLRMDLVNAQGQVLASGVAAESGLSLEHFYVDHRALGNRNKAPVYLRLTALNRTVEYDLNAHATRVNSSDPRLAWDLGTVGAGFEKQMTLTENRNLSFKAAASGPLHVMTYFSNIYPFSDRIPYVNLRDEAGNLLSLLPPNAGSASDLQTITFNAVQGETYYLSFPRVFTVLTLETRLLFLDGNVRQVETEPNNGTETANALGALNEWVIAADGNVSGGEASRKDVFEVTAGQDGILVYGMNPTYAIVKPFVNGELARRSSASADLFVRQGDVIRFEVDTFRSQLPYNLSGRILPVTADDDVYERNETLGLVTLLPLDRVDKEHLPLLHNASDSDSFEIDTQPGVYVAAIETTAPSSAYRFRVEDKDTGEVVAQGAHGPNGLAASFTATGGRYRMIVSAEAGDARQNRYLPRMERVQSIDQTAQGAVQSYSDATVVLGQIDVDFVGDIELKIASDSADFARFGTVLVALLSDSQGLVSRTLSDEQPSTQFAVRPGRYFVSLQKSFAQPMRATIQFQRMPGDADGDGIVGMRDFALLQASMGNATAPFKSGDLNGDGQVNMEDFALLRVNFNKRR